MVINDNKEEKLPVIADYNFDKTAPTKMSKKRESLGSSLTQM